MLPLPAIGDAYIEFRQLQYFAAIADEENFSRAAARLGVAQPSLSQQIRKLERELGQPLFDRLPRRVALTPLGEQLLVHARRALAEIADARRCAEDAAGDICGPLAIGAIPTITPFLMPRLLARYEKTFPRVQLRVVDDVTDVLMRQLELGQIDLAILSSVDPIPPSIHVETICREPLMLMLPANHPLTRRRVIPWASLAHERFLALHAVHCLAGQVSSLCDRRGVHPPIILHGAHLATLASMVSAGLGLSLVPRMMALASASDVPVFRPLGPPRPERLLTLAWSLLRYRTRAAREFAAMAALALRAMCGRRLAPASVRH